ncbi:olfactory receptor 14A16-like [Anser cygnoides]|uniref:olfactory receptor 14A16-like n=1 Tax=Anser cygnoides TaxID=8845 RepID=UPI0034D2FED6
MYFFLLNLALLDLGTITSTVPKAMANSLWDTRAISFIGCVTQVFMFVTFVTAEFYLLTIMAYDRYVSVCKPLHYWTIMDSRTCVNMAAAAWGSTFLYSVLHTANTFSLPLCQGNALDQFFCEIPQILKLSCSDAYLREVAFLVFCFCSGTVRFAFLLLSYVQIFRAVLRMPSQQGQNKAFSTCLPHLAVVSLFISNIMFAYLKPLSMSSSSLDLLLAVLYSVVPPTLNPLIYSMRNKELKDAVISEKKVSEPSPELYNIETLSNMKSHTTAPLLLPVPSEELIAILCSTPGKIIHRENEAVIGDSQHVFTKGILCLTNLMVFYDKVTALVDRGRATDIIYLNLYNAFDNGPP